MAITTAKVPLGGTVGKSNYLDKVVDDLTMLDAATNGAWTDWSSSFTLQAQTTNPTLGGSTKAARYKRMGKTVHFAFEIVIGSGFSAGSGNYLFPLPVAPAGFGINPIGLGYVLDNGTDVYQAVMNSYDSTRMYMVLSKTSSYVSSSGPGTPWAVGDTIKGFMTYEAA